MSFESEHVVKIIESFTKVQEYAIEKQQLLQSYSEQEEAQSPQPFDKARISEEYIITDNTKPNLVEYEHSSSSDCEEEETKDATGTAEGTQSNDNVE